MESVFGGNPNPSVKDVDAEVIEQPRQEKPAEIK
jgi:hypothetical protein